MQGSQFDRAVTVTEASSLDLSPEPVVLGVSEGYLTAEYRGLYTFASRRVPAPDLDEFEAAFPAKELSRLARLFGSAQDLRVKFSDPKLAINEGRRRSTLMSIAMGPHPTANAPQVHADLNLRELASEIRIVREAVSNTYAAPILTGIRIVAGNDRIGFQACNAASALAETSIDADTREALDVVVPVKDIDMAIKILEDGETTHARLGMLGRGRFTLQSDTAFFIGSTLMGNWPRFQRFRGAAADTYMLDTRVLADVADASDALAPKSDIEFVPDNGEVTIQIDSRIGSYAVSVPGTIDRPHRMAIDDVRIAARMGEQVEMGLRDDGSAIFTTGRRTLYALNRVGVSSAAPA